MKNDSPTARAVLADPSSIDTLAELAAQRAREAAARFGGWYEDDTFDPYLDEPEVDIPRAPDTIPAPPPAEARVVDECRKLVHALAWRAAKRSGQNVDDLIQEAWLAVLEQIPDFDPARGVSLASFVFAGVRWHLQKVAEHEKRRGLSTQRSKGMGRCLVAIAANFTDSIDAEDDTGRNLHDRIGGDGLPADVALSDAHERAVVECAVAALDARDREVLALLDEDLTHAEVAARIGVTPPRVSGIVAEIEQRVRSHALHGYMPARNNTAKVAGEDGTQITLAEASRRSGVPYFTLRQRVRGGWTLAEAMATPVDTRHHAKRPRGRAA